MNASKGDKRSVVEKTRREHCPTSLRQPVILQKTMNGNSELIPGRIIISKDLGFANQDHSWVAFIDDAQTTWPVYNDGLCLSII